MAEATIPVDLFNPGQVFACIGFVEAADVLLGEAAGAFDWSNPRDVRFRIRAAGDESPVRAVLQFLKRAEIFGEVVPNSRAREKWKTNWGPLNDRDPEQGYPFPDPTAPAMVVCVMSDGEQRLQLDYWGDDTQRDNTKFWAGARGFPGVGLARDAVELVRHLLDGAESDPLNVPAAQSSSFRLDWRRDYIPLDAGFSLNKQPQIVAVGYPLVEVLAALGLSNARPKRPKPRDKLLYRYGVIAHPAAEVLPLPLLRAALGGVTLPFPNRHFRMQLNWPGQENQARAITTVTEEINP